MLPLQLFYLIGRKKNALFWRPIDFGTMASALLPFLHTSAKESDPYKVQRSPAIEPVNLTERVLSSLKWRVAVKFRCPSNPHSNTDWVALQTPRAVE